MASNLGHISPKWEKGNYCCQTIILDIKCQKLNENEKKIDIYLVFELRLLLVELVDDEQDLWEGLLHPAPAGDHPLTVVRLQQGGRLGVGGAGYP